MMPGNITYRLYREVIEIQDGLLALRPYMDPAATETAREAAGRAGLTGSDLQAAVQAAMLDQALRAKGAAPGKRTGEAQATRDPYLSRSSHYTAEATWLLSVARAFSALRPRNDP
ncbi:DUF6545 domain-containing protein [Streptomyces violascens]|uniref:DUF6545 domain-containing protein n=1 Tax=Streptomyces violascens TaxID=67381 RepID=UPI0036B2ED07